MSDITMNELLLGKSTIIKNKEFYPTKNYVEPFVEKMSKFTDRFEIKVKLPEQMTTNKGNTDVTYNRVVVEAVLPKKYTIDDHDEVIGLVYGIDVRKPVVKLYRGYLNQVCTNLCVFNPSWLNVQELLPGDPINYTPIKELMEKQNDFALMLDRLKSTFLDRTEQKRYLGEWVDYALREGDDYGFGKVKIAVSTPVEAYKQLFVDQDSQYYVPQGIDPTLFDVYNSFTQIITDDKRDILQKFEKTMIINKLLDVYKV